jgi:hypothetical protein
VTPPPSAKEECVGGDDRCDEGLCHFADESERPGSHLCSKHTDALASKERELEEAYKLLARVALYRNTVEESAAWLREAKEFLHARADFLARARPGGGK